MSLKKKIYITFITIGIIALIIFFGFVILFAYIGEGLRAILLTCNSMALLSGVVGLVGHLKDMK